MRSPELQRDLPDIKKEYSPIAETDRRGIFIIDDVEYDLGEEFADKEIVRLDPDTFCVANLIRNKLLKHSSGLSLRKKDDETSYYDQNILATFRMKDGEIIDLKPFQSSEFQPKRTDETDEEYQNRIWGSGNDDLRILKQIKRQFRETGNEIDLDSLSVREQMSFAQYYYTNFYDRKKIFDFVNMFGIDGLKTFLACEYGMKIGDEIIDLGERLPQETAEKIFEKYTEIVNLCDQAVAEIKNEFKRKATPKTVDKIRDNLLSRAKRLLESFYAQAGRNITPEDMMHELDNINTDIILFAASFKSLAESEEKIDLTEMAQAAIETKQASELTPREIDSLKRIFQKNWEERYPGKLSDLIFKDFEEIIESDSEFYILKRNGDIVAFLRTTETSPNTLEVGSFNVRSEAMKTKLGEAFLEQTINELAKTNILRCSVYAPAKSLLDYYKKFGFKIVGITPPPPGEVSTFLDMERNDARRNHLRNYDLAA